jgi:hypothetical protein
MNQTINELDQVVATLDQGTAVTVKSSFSEFLEQVKEWEEKAYSVNVTSIDQVELMTEAGTARKALVKIRTAADKRREDLKRDSLNYGRAVQECYNLIANKLKPMEEHLGKQEKFAELEEAKRKAELKQARLNEVHPWIEFLPSGVDLGELNEDSYDLVKSGMQQKFNNKQAQIEEEQRAAKITAIHNQRRQQIAMYWGFLTDNQRNLNFGTITDDQWNSLFESAKEAYQMDLEERAKIRAENERLKSENELVKSQIAPDLSGNIKAGDNISVFKTQNYPILTVDPEMVIGAHIPNQPTGATDKDALSAWRRTLDNIVDIPAMTTDAGALAAVNIQTLISRLKSYVDQQIEKL